MRPTEMSMAETPNIPSGGQIDVADVVDTTPLGLPRILLFALCAIVITLEGFDVQIISFVAPVIIEQWNVHPSAFGTVFASGLLGLMAGQLSGGVLGDRIGRRKIILVCTLLFGTFTFLTSFADDTRSLILLRFLTGIGLGGAMTNIISLASEYAPRRIRATIITAILFGFPMGAIIGGLVSNAVVATDGWQTVFRIGGIFPILLVVILVFALPESVRFLITVVRSQELTGRTVRRLWPARFSDDASFVLSEPMLSGFSAKHLFLHGRTPVTLLLWVTFFMNLLGVYFLVSWLPILVKRSGLPTDIAINAGVILNVGGAIGGVFLGRLIDRFNGYFTLACAYATVAVSMIVIALFGSQLAVLMAAVFVAGFGVIGGQTGLLAVTAGSHPTPIRSTALGWGQGIGRIGSIVGPIVGGILLAKAWTTQDLFALGAVPSCIAAAAIAALGVMLSRRGATH